MKSNNNNNNTRCEMWTDTNTLLLIDEYRRHPCLWDPTDQHFKMMGKKSDAWQEVALAMQCSVPEIKRKMASVLASFRRERKRERKSMWFAYKPLSFLLEKFNSKKEKSVEGEDDNDLIENEEWWNEHDTLNDEPDLLLSNSEIDDKSDIKYHGDYPDNFPTITHATSPNDNTHTFADSEETSNQLQRRHSRKRIKMCKVVDDHSLEPEIVTHPRRQFKNVSKTKSICDLFASYVAAKLESYTEYRRNIVEHKINEVLFQADMETFDKNTPPDQTQANTSSQNGVP